MMVTRTPFLMCAVHLLSNHWGVPGPLPCTPYWPPLLGPPVLHAGIFAAVITVPAMSSSEQHASRLWRPSIWTRTGAICNFAARGGSLSCQKLTAIKTSFGVSILQVLPHSRPLACALLSKVVNNSELKQGWNVTHQRSKQNE